MRFPDGPVSSGDGEDRSEQQPPALVPIGSKPHNGSYTACVAAGRPNLVLCTRPGGRLWTCEIRPDDAIFFADLARGEGGAGDHHGGEGTGDRRIDSASLQEASDCGDLRRAA